LQVSVVKIGNAKGIRLASSDRNQWRNITGMSDTMADELCRLVFVFWKFQKIPVIPKGFGGQYQWHIHLSFEMSYCAPLVLGCLSFYFPWASLKVNDYAPLVLGFIFLFMTGTAHWINGLAPLALDWVFPKIPWAWP